MADSGVENNEIESTEDRQGLVRGFPARRVVLEIEGKNAGVGTPGLGDMGEGHFVATREDELGSQSPEFQGKGTAQP